MPISRSSTASAQKHILGLERESHEARRIAERAFSAQLRSMNRENGRSDIEAKTVRLTASDSDENSASVLFYLLCVEPGGAVFTNDHSGFFDRVHAMRDGEIDLAGEFVACADHRAATPF